VSFDEWLISTYEQEWNQYKEELKSEGYSIDVILNEKRALLEQYAYDKKEGLI
jgi:hypothetical protein